MRNLPPVPVVEPPSLPVQQRAAALMVATADLHYDDAIEAARAQLAAEEAAEAESRRRMAELTDVVDAMTTCPAPGCRAAKAAGAEACGEHMLAIRYVEMREAAAVVLADGRSAADWAAEVIAERRARATRW
jgi:hypothetical protein